MTDQFIWWLRPEEIGIALGSLALPGWLNDQLVSAHGRNGRGRLWRAPHLVEVSVDEPWPETPLAKHCEMCAGIVVTAAELGMLQHFPGVVTDLRLRRLP